MINPNKRLKTKHVIDLDSDSVPEIPDVPMPEPSQPEEKPEMFQSKMISDVSDVVVTKQTCKCQGNVPGPSSERGSSFSSVRTLETCVSVDGNSGTKSW